ncbi:MAG: hypothetical protein Q7R34_09785 [Dehalococcoidia bacterium]|nr:hypothetical protein [Dehalococcoidia bacterium]
MRLEGKVAIVTGASDVGTAQGALDYAVRYAKGLQLLEGTNQIQRNAVVRVLLG